MKKVIAILISLIFVFVFVSCGIDPDEKETSAETDNTNISVENNKHEAEVVTKVIVNDEGTTEIIEVEMTDKEETVVSTEKVTEKVTENTTKKNNTQLSKNPSDWNKEQVVAFYKAACADSSHVTSEQTMHMRKDSLKAEGGLGSFLGIAEPIIRGVMKLNHVDVPGITGGHENLSADDCKTAKAYKSGDYIVVEMTMKDQVDGIYGKRNEGHIGHAIFVVDGVAEVAEQFSQFDVRYKDADIKIYYTDAKLKVKINSDGIIEKGTWTYVCTPVVNNLYIEGIVVNDAGAVIDYAVTLNGGF